MIDSIKLKLIVWFLSVFSVIFTGLGFFLYFELRDIVVDTVDSHLNYEVSLLAGLLGKEAEHGHIKEGFMEIAGAASEQYAVALSGHYYQLVDSEGEIIGRSPSLELAGESLPVDDIESFPATSYKTVIGPSGTPQRLVAHSFKLAGKSFTFLASDSLEESYYVLRSFRNIILIVFPVIYLLFITGNYFITRWALRTLDNFSAKVGRITARNLNERVDEENIDHELRPVARSFNTMLGSLEEAFARQREFMSDASHELRTPTSVIKSHCDVALRRERSPEEYRRTLTGINRVSGKMAAIIERILEASRLESKIYNMKVVKIDILSVIKDSLKLIEPYAAERGVKVRLTGDAVELSGDRERLTEVFINIIDNGVKYNKPGGSVDINVVREGLSVVVTVADTGIGLSPEEMDKVFDRFYRVDKSREVVPGSGLGLPIVKAIVESHRGHVEFESTPGEGSVFRVIFAGN